MQDTFTDSTLYFRFIIDTIVNIPIYYTVCACAKLSFSCVYASDVVQSK